MCRDNLAGCRRCVVTITDSISPTSMPYNEFVLYRRINRPDERQILIILFESNIDRNVAYPQDLEIIRCGKDLCKLGKEIKRIANECEINNIQYVFHIHEGKSVIFFNVATLGKYRSRIIYTIHSTYKNYPFHNKLFASLATLISYRVVCVSETSYRYFPTWLKTIFPERIIAVQNGVDTDRINNVLSDYKRTTNQLFCLIYVARFVACKRHEILLQAISRIENCELLLIGKGPREEELRKLVAELGVGNRVEFVGALPREKVFENIIQADVYVSSSSYEGLPISVLEAMCCGTPCVVSDIEQHREIADQCEALITVKDSVDDWVEKLNEVRIESDENRKSIGYSLKQTVTDNFSLHRMHLNYEKIYQSIWDK